jgi:hypothetical protein
VDGTDPLKVYEVVGKAVKRARAGQGPSLIESKFYRFSTHGNAITVPPVPTQFPEHEAIETYGRKAEYAAARARDRIQTLRLDKLDRAGAVLAYIGDQTEGVTGRDMEPARRVSTSLRPVVMEFSEHFHLR